MPQTDVMVTDKSVQAVSTYFSNKGLACDAHDFFNAFFSLFSVLTALRSDENDKTKKKQQFNKLLGVKPKIRPPQKEAFPGFLKAQAALFLARTRWGKVTTVFDEEDFSAIVKVALNTQKKALFVSSVFEKNHLGEIVDLKLQGNYSERGYTRRQIADQTMIFESLCSSCAELFFSNDEYIKVVTSKFKQANSKNDTVFLANLLDLAEQALLQPLLTCLLEKEKVLIKDIDVLKKAIGGIVKHPYKEQGIQQLEECKARYESQVRNESYIILSVDVEEKAEKQEKKQEKKQVIQFEKKEQKKVVLLLQYLAFKQGYRQFFFDESIESKRLKVKGVASFSTLSDSYNYQALQLFLNENNCTLDIATLVFMLEKTQRLIGADFADNISDDYPYDRKTLKGKGVKASNAIAMLFITREYLHETMGEHSTSREFHALLATLLEERISGLTANISWQTDENKKNFGESIGCTAIVYPPKDTRSQLRIFTECSKFKTADALSAKCKENNMAVFFKLPHSFYQQFARLAQIAPYPLFEKRQAQLIDWLNQVDINQLVPISSKMWDCIDVLDKYGFIPVVLKNAFTTNKQKAYKIFYWLFAIKRQTSKPERRETLTEIQKLLKVLFMPIRKICAYEKERNIEKLLGKKEYQRIKEALEGQAGDAKIYALVKLLLERQFELKKISSPSDSQIQEIKNNKALLLEVLRYLLFVPVLTVTQGKQQQVINDFADLFNHLFAPIQIKKRRVRKDKLQEEKKSREFGLSYLLDIVTEACRVAKGDEQFFLQSLLGQLIDYYKEHPDFFYEHHIGIEAEQLFVQKTDKSDEAIACFFRQCILNNKLQKVLVTAFKAMIDNDINEEAFYRIMNIGLHHLGERITTETFKKQTCFAFSSVLVKGYIETRKNESDYARFFLNVFTKEEKIKAANKLKRYLQGDSDVRFSQREKGALEQTGSRLNKLFKLASPLLPEGDLPLVQDVLLAP